MAEKLSQPNPARSGWPWISLAAMLWASDQMLRPKAQAAGLTSLQIVLFEHLALAAIFVPFLIKGRAEWRGLGWKSWAGLAFLAVFGSAIATLMLTEAYRLGSPLITALLQKTQPIFTVTLAGFALSERRKPIFWVCFAGALVATYLLAFGFTGVSGTSASLAVCLALGAAAIWGICTVVGREATFQLSPSIVAGWRFLLALPVLLAMNLGSSSGPIGAHVNWQSIWPVAIIVLLPDAIGMFIYYVGLKRTPASLATLAELAFPATALVIGLVFRHEALNLGQWLGLALLLVCLHVIQMTKSISTQPIAA